MTGEEIAGPAGPKVLRLLYFAGAGFIFTIAMNKWREMEQKSMLQQKQEKLNHQFSESPNDAVPKIVE